MGGARPEPDGAGFAIVLPTNWELLDLDPRTRDRSVQRMVTRGLGKADHLARLRHEAVVAYRRMLVDAEDNGAFLAANVSETVAGTVLAASVLAFFVPLPRGEDGTPMSGVEEMSVALGQPAEGERALEVSIVELAVGRAVRVRALARSELTGSDGRHPEVQVVRFFVPAPDLGGMLVMAFSTPSLFAADAFAELFDALARSASWRLAEPAP